MKYLMMLGLLFVTAPNLAKADSQFGLSLFRYQAKVETASSSTSTTSSFYDLKVNTSVGPIYIGGIYGMLADGDTGSEYGVTIGSRSKSGFFSEFHYFLAAERKSDPNEYKKGSGYGLDFGYNAMVGKSFYLGLQFAYRTITYKEVDTATADYELTTLKPMINLGFMF